MRPDHGLDQPRRRKLGGTDARRNGTLINSLAALWRSAAKLRRMTFKCRQTAVYLGLGFGELHTFVSCIDIAGDVG
jgi:hypothetical protein